ncbi:ribosome maturation factor RimP [Gordonia sp. (in: high G+C Gram-positive bacteria)]|uniref:ribosome maturation factor RimP n=1 Tax=Gordonia sp. (in: high G+C Gram-positive bacteria) TaxID=84139 RepID=UPI003C7467BD
MAGEALTGKLGDLVTPVVAQLGFDLEELAVLTPPGRRDVRIIVDRDGGSTLDALAEVSRELETVIEASGLLGDSPYDLELTTPGIGRPLTLPRHWRRNQGRKVHVEYSLDGVDKSGEARIGVSDDNQVTLVLVDKSRISTVDVPYTNITKAVGDVDFTKPGEAALRACGLDDDEITRRRQSPQNAAID